jgi:single-strand DNA-binding protein
MASDNTVTLVGNITDDPELRFTPSGRPVANFTIAVNRRYKNQEGNWEDKLDGFFRCSCWADMAENVAESLTKGSRVMIVGRLQQRSWDDQEGNKRSTVEVQVDEVGPSLRWATAQVQKSQRSGGGQGGGGGDWGGRPQQQAPPQQAPQQAQGGGDPSGGWGAPASVGGAQPSEEGGF